MPAPAAFCSGPVGVEPSDGSTPTGPLQNPAGVGMITNTSGFQEIGSPYSAAEGQQYTPGTSSYGASPFSTPAPGTAVMRINMQAVAMFEGAWWTGQNGQGFGTTAAAGAKENPYGVNAWMRIDLAVDGMSKAGVRYGAFAEVREESVGNNFTSTTSATPVTAAQSTSADNYYNVLYARNICAYVGTDAAGIVKIGQGSCVDTGSAMDTGLNDEFDYGGWDAANGIFPGFSPTWPWPDSGADYMPQGIAYYSPVLAGFDLATSFNPSNNTAAQTSACSSTYYGCTSQSTSNSASDLSRWTNRFEIGLRYRNAIGPIGFAVQGTWAHSGQVQPGPTAPATSPVTSGSVRYNPLNFANIGAEVSINKYIAIGATTLFGAFNGPGAMQPKPIDQQTSTTTAIAWEAGGKFTVPNLPLSFGASYFNFKFQGQAGLPSQRVSQGIDIGGSYGLGPGMVAYAEYLWGQNSQGGYNFLTGACASLVCGSHTNAGANNQVQVQVAMLGLALQF